MDDSIFAAALSVLPYAAAKDALCRIKDYSAREVVAHFSGTKTVKHVAALYGDDLLRAAERICGKMERLRGKIILVNDAEYPPLLREIAFPPLALYCRGNILKDDKVAIVGTRKSTAESDSAACAVAAGLGAVGITIVSGMAVGVDRSAHLGALNGGYATIAVLANGLDISYPSSNKDIFVSITASENSTLVTEYPPGIRGDKWTFVRRNRIISGMSKGVVVVKAAQKSGAMITARYALEQNRELFVCPGHAFDDSYAGCNLLIREGAVLIRGVGDILDELGVQLPLEIKEEKTYLPKMERAERKKEFHNMSPDEIRVYDAVFAAGEADADELMRLFSIDAAVMNRILTMLEVEGAVERRGSLVVKV